jgi:hypothetical protein
MRGGRAETKGAARGRRRRGLLVGFSFLGAVGASACTTFDDPSTVLDLRILAASVEPSEVIVDDVSTLPSLRLKPLVADHQGDVVAPQFSIVACPNQPFGPAPPADPMASGGFPAGGARGTLSSTLCPADPAAPHRWSLATAADVQDDGSVTLNLTPDQLQDALMSDLFRDQFGNLHGGFDLGLPINLEIDVTRGDGVTVKAVKRVLFWFPQLVPAIAGETPNQTPVISAVEQATGRNDDAVLENVSPFDENALPTVAPGGELWVRPSLATQEPYLTTVLDATTGQVLPYPVATETLRYSFFATSGKFSPSETSTDPGRGVRWNDGKPHLEAKYEAPDAAEVPVDPATGKPRLDVTVWIVVRDDRGGASWEERHLRVGEP